MTASAESFARFSRYHSAAASSARNVARSVKVTRGTCRAGSMAGAERRQVFWIGDELPGDFARLLQVARLTCKRGTEAKALSQLSSTRAVIVEFEPSEAGQRAFRKTLLALRAPTLNSGALVVDALKNRTDGARVSEIAADL